MIATSKHSPRYSRFLTMLPTIERTARQAFRRLRPEAREDAVQEVIANSLVAFVRLCERDKVDLAYPTVLARYGIAQVRGGRRVGGRLNANDVLSRYAQRRKGFSVARLDERTGDDEWQEAVVEDRRTTPAETAAVRVDFAEWLRKLRPRPRKIAERLACGDSTSEVSRLVGLTCGRISQMRRELSNSWASFQGELAAA